MARIARHFRCSLAGGMLLLLAAVPSAASHLTVLYRFTGGTDGNNPAGPLARDAHGNLYGTTDLGGQGHGVAFRVTPNDPGKWQETVLHSFTDASPNPGLTMDRKGALYGSSLGSNYSGLVFQLTPPAVDGGDWGYNALFNFPGVYSAQGGAPSGNLLLDSKGDIFGVTQYGGDVNGSQPCECGLVYSLSQQSGSWTETVLYAFGNLPDGNIPVAGLTLGPDGILFGTTYQGGTGYCLDGSGVVVVGCGTVFSLSGSNGSWTETTLHDFKLHEENNPTDAMTPGADGNLYGVAGLDVFRMLPPRLPGAPWHKQVIYEFPGGITGTAPTGAVVFDSKGNLYGVTRSFGIDGPATLFRISPPADDHVPWIETTLFQFHTGSDFSDQPFGGVIRAKDGTLYGAVGASSGSHYGYVFAFAP